MSRLILAAVLFLAASAPLSADAQYVGISCDTGCALALIGAGVGGLAFLTMDVILISESIDKAARLGHGLYTAGAVLELIFGGLQLAGGVLSLVGGIAEAAGDSGSNGEGWFIVGVPLTLVGGYLVGHGIWSLTAGRPPPDEPALRVGLAPQPGGGMASLSLTF